MFGKGGEILENPQYLCIDLKSFYASVECVERGLDPMTTDLVVADRPTFCKAQMPHFASVAVRTAVQLAIQNQACAKPRTEGHEDHIFRTAPRTEPPFRNRASIRIVLKRRF